jgi:hypothetical protein
MITAIGTNRAAERQGSDDQRRSFLRHQQASLRPSSSRLMPTWTARTSASCFLTFFYRQMTGSCGRARFHRNRRFIKSSARSEEYVDDDVQLNKILISLGAEDVRLKNLADGRTERGAIERPRIARKAGQTE